MKKILKSFLALSLLIINNLNSQTSKKIDSVYNDYFNLTREIPYLHLNKTAFIKGENLWFKAYVLNLNSKNLHQETSNLYCSLFDENGVLKDQKLLFVKNGIASGNFKIDSSFNKKNYYLKASTNYMKNFKEDESFIQKITVLNNNSPSKAELNNSIDYQLLPEGGHLITNAHNTLGIIVKNPMNKGIKIQKGEILENNKIINTFLTNKLGLAKINLFLKPNSNYKAKIYLDNKLTITKNFPTIKQKGINLRVHNPSTNVTEFIFSTNQNTHKHLTNKNYYFLIHNTNRYLKRKLIFKPNTNQLSYIIKNEKLQPGTNIITLFNDKNIPIIERVFFNYNKSLFTNIKTTFNLINDSLQVSIRNDKKSTKKTFLSVSVLPNNTKSYSPKQSIYSKFLLSPYVKGSIEDPNYYFDKINRKKLYELDLLLLTQGWSKYNWHRIFNSPPAEYFEFDKGITMEGTINSKVPKGQNQIVLVSNDNNSLIIDKLKGNKFKFKNLYLDNNSDFSLATLTNSQKLKKIKAYIRFSPKTNLSNLNLKNTNFNNNHLSYTNFSVLGESIKLDEVIVKGKKRPKNIPVRSHSDLRSFPIDQSHLKNINVLSYIRTQGFVVNESFGRATIRIPYNINHFTEVFLDNQPILNQFINQLDFISFLTLESFNEILISRSFGGTIYLYSNKYHKKDSKKLFSKFTTPLGYSKQKKYYQPKYSSNTDNEFKKYGAIYWEPNVDLTNDDFLLKFDHLGQKRLKLFIEGISEDGKLIKTEKIIDLTK